MKPSKEMVRIANRAAKIVGLDVSPKMIVKKIKRGRAHTRDGYFTIPLWVTNRHHAMLTAYIIHEICHFSRSVYVSYFNGGNWSKAGWNCRSHGKDFRYLETLALESFGLRSVYQDGKCYLIELRDLKTKEPICNGYGMPYPRIEACWI